MIAALEVLEGSKLPSPSSKKPGFLSTLFPASGTPSLLSSLLEAGEDKRGEWEIVFSSLLGAGYMPALVCEVVSVSALSSSSSSPSSSPSAPLPASRPIRIDTSAAGGLLPLGSVVGDYVWEGNKMTFGFNRFEVRRTRGSRNE